MVTSRTAHRRAAPDRRSWIPAVVVLGVVMTGVAAKVSCLGPDGLTLGETALPWCYSDVAGIYQGRGLEAGLLPYRDVLTEYPPLTGLQWWLAGLGSRSVTGFYLATAILQAVAAVAVVVLLDRHGVPRRRLLLLAVAPTLLLVATVNWDLVAVALLTAGLLASGQVPRGGASALDPVGDGAEWQRTAIGSGVLLGLGGLAKLFPLVAVPVLAWGAWQGGRAHWAVHHVAAALVTVAVVQIPVALWAPSGWAAWVGVQRDRPVDWDTLWYGLQVVVGRTLASDVADGLIVVLSVVGVALIMGRGRRWPPADTWQLVLPIVVWLLLVGKVHSPQFSLWLLPLLALSRVPLPLVGAWMVADAAVVLTRFPFLAGQQGIDPSLPYVAFGVPVLLRALLLVAVLAVALTPSPPTPVSARP